jgi:adenylyltransferase/sulfurtransferase
MIGCWEAIEALKLIVRMGEEGDSTKLTNLLGRQILFDCAHAESYGFDLPPRDLSCAVCGENPTILSLADTETTLMEYRELAQREAKSYIGELESAHSIPVTQYAVDYLQNVRKHIILDVRSKVQFGLSSFVSLESVHHVQSLPNQSDELASSDNTAILVNVPLSELRADLSTNSRRILNTLGSTNDKLDVIVVCRRGIDSMVAARLLKEVGLKSVYNLSGGLTAWKKDIDPSFPMY